MKSETRDLAPRGIPSGARLTVIDGVRGWAAFNVLLFHLFFEIFGKLVPGFRTEWTYFVINGPLAVSVFFVLSGDALSAAFFRRGAVDGVHQLFVKRYLRLELPILCSCCFTFAILFFHLNFNGPAADIVGRADWLGSFANFSPGLHRLLRYSLVDVFAIDEPRTAYNPFLWTMSYELTGSLLVFLVLYVYRELRFPRASVFGLALAFSAFQLHYAAFLVGLLLSQLRADGVLERLRGDRRWRLATGIAPLALAVVGTVIRDTSLNGVRMNTLIGAGLVLSAYTNPAWSAFFGSRLSQALGKLSFPLYLCQFSVLISFTSYLIVRANAQGQLTLAMIWAIIAASIAATLLVSIAFSSVERATLSICAAFARLLLVPKREASARASAGANGVSGEGTAARAVIPLHEQTHSRGVGPTG